MNISLKRNVGNADRTLRVLLGILLLYLVAFKPVAISTVWAVILGVAGFAMLVEGAVGY